MNPAVSHKGGGGGDQASRKQLVLFDSLPYHAVKQACMRTEFNNRGLLFFQIFFPRGGGGGGGGGALDDHDPCCMYSDDST